MNRWISLVSLLTITTALACNSQAGPQSSSETRKDEPVGMLQLSLTGVDSQMQQYRLRAATFDIQGTRYTDYQSVSTSVSSETDIDNPFVRARLFYGSYSVSLRPEDWYMERITPDGAQRVDQAVLLSTQSMSVYVQQGGVSQIGFQFGVDGELIDFLGGDLDIGISVQRAPNAQAGAGGS
jgi:hypothetical protein